MRYSFFFDYYHIRSSLLNQSPQHESFYDLNNRKFSKAHRVEIPRFIVHRTKTFSGEALNR